MHEENILSLTEPGTLLPGGHMTAGTFGARGPVLKGCAKQTSALPCFEARWSGDRREVTLPNSGQEVNILGTRTTILKLKHLKILSTPPSCFPERYSREPSFTATTFLSWLNSCHTFFLTSPATQSCIYVYAHSVLQRIHSSQGGFSHFPFMYNRPTAEKVGHG